MALVEYTGFDWRIAFTAITILIFIAAEVYSHYIPQGKRFQSGCLAIAILIVAALWLTGEIARTILLDVAALVLVIMVWSQYKHAGQLFLLAALLGSLLVAVGMALGGLFSENAAQPAGLLAKVVIVLILTGFALKLAVIPFSFWLAPLTEHTSPMTAVLVISLLDMSEFGSLISLRITAPWIFSSIQWVWIALALLSMFGGALLALAQKNVRRMLAFSTIDDMGYLLLGLAAGTVGGVLGAAIGAISHALCKFLLFGSVGVAENDLDHPVTTDDRGLASHHPVAGAAFIAGSLGMIGVPPLLGFLGRWRLYNSGVETGGIGLVIAMAAATALAILYYVRVIHKVWLGQALANPSSTQKRFLWIEVTFIAVIVLLIVATLYPAILPGMGGR
ncbi:MAG: proton-conducting transporter membrane subunit [Anaerolineaceae bacterium]